MSKTGDIVTIKMTDDPDSSDFEYMAHRRGDTQKDVFYIGAYLGYVADNKLRSLSGKSHTLNTSHREFISYCRNLGRATDTTQSGYEMEAWFQVMYINAMYILRFKNLNQTSILGNGYGNKGKSITTGVADTLGMFSTQNANKSDVPFKMFGLESFRGSGSPMIAGCRIGSDKKIYVNYTTFHPDETGWEYGGITVDTNLANLNYVKKMHVNNKCGLIASTGSASQTTYYCTAQDIIWPSSGYYYAKRSQYFSHNTSFSSYGVGFNSTHENAYSEAGARLMYL